MKYPRWKVEGRDFDNCDHARYFADWMATETGRNISIMQKDDNMLLWFRLEVRHPSNVNAA